MHNEDDRRYQHRYGHQMPGREEVGKWKENLVSIADLKEHEEGKVAFVRGGSMMLRRLLDMGITTNTTIHIIKAAPFGGPVEIAVRGSKLALGRGIASNVFVEVVKDSEESKKNVQADKPLPTAK